MSGHRVSFLLLIYTFLMVFGGCKGQTENKKAIEMVTVTDNLGRKVQVPAQPRRILGLAPSATEMLYAVADEQTIAGRTQVCNFPEKVKSKPVVTTYPMDYEALVLLQPDLVVTVEGITPPEVAAKLQELHIPVYYQKFEKVEDVFRGLEDLGRLLHREKQARQVTDSLRAALKALTTPRTAAQPARVLAITWPDPIYVYGQNTLFTDKLRYLGAANAVTESFPQPYPALTREYILQLNPDVIIGGTFEKMEQTFFKLYPELRRINAYRNRRIFEANDDLMTRPGPRVVDAIRELKNLIY